MHLERAFAPHLHFRPAAPAYEPTAAELTRGSTQALGSGDGTAEAPGGRDVEVRVVPNPSFLALGRPWRRVLPELLRARGLLAHGEAAELAWLVWISPQARTHSARPGSRRLPLLLPLPSQ